MSEEDERRIAFEERLSALKAKMEAGLPNRAQSLRDAARRLREGDESARKVLKQESHKLRGIAGSYGHQHLTEMAGELEQRASLSPPPMLEKLAHDLAEAADEVGRRSTVAHDPVQESTSQRAAATTATPTTSGNAKSSTPATHGVASEAPNDATAARKTPKAPLPSTPSRKRGASLRPQVLGADGGALRVLAMDDDPTTLRLLKLTLKDIGGFDAVIVTSAREGLALLKEREFDVVISDAMMPDLNGRQFCEEARKLGGAAEQVPFVILSAATPDELGWQGMRGPVEWLRKPFMPSTLVKDVARIVETARKKRG